MRRLILFTFLVILCIAGFFGWTAYNHLYAPNISGEENGYSFYVEQSDNTDVILKNLEESSFILNRKSISKVGKWIKFDRSKAKVGHYRFDSKMNTKKILDVLRKGEQTPIKMTCHQVRFTEQLAGIPGKHLCQDSIDYLTAIKTYAQKNKISKETLLCHFIPDTYEFYYSTSPEEFVKRLVNEGKKYWKKNDRLKKASLKGLTKLEVYTLASIVEKETNYNPEKPTVAGVYINRLNRGIPLQADPTVVYAMGDFTIRRVLNKYLQKDSPYNTYKNAGLPPGPICMPSKSSIDAVLNAEHHSYIYFCAKPDGGGQHAFARNLTEHNRNARAFQKWLNSRGIKR